MDSRGPAGPLALGMINLSWYISQPAAEFSWRHTEKMKQFVHTFIYLLIYLPIYLFDFFFIITFYVYEKVKHTLFTINKCNKCYKCNTCRDEQLRRHWNTLPLTIAGSRELRVIFLWKNIQESEAMKTISQKREWGFTMIFFIKSRNTQYLFKILHRKQQINKNVFT